MNTTPQRAYWTGEQADLGDARALCSGEKTARCVQRVQGYGATVGVVL